MTKNESFNKYNSDEWAAIIFFLSGSWVPLYTTSVIATELFIFEQNFS